MTFSEKCNVLDKLVAIFVLLVLSPLWILTCIIIKLSNPKLPAISKLERYGKNKKVFNLYKFRTFKMCKINGKYVTIARKRDPDNPMSRDKNDIRLTKFGKFIRKLSIDEIPNLFNVLKGDLKIIGVRPCEKDEIQYLPPERFNYLPGMSGITSREGNKNPTLEEQYQEELYFSTHYGKEVKKQALKNGFKVIWNNK